MINLYIISCCKAGIPIYLKLMYIRIIICILYNVKTEKNISYPQLTERVNTNESLLLLLLENYNLNYFLVTKKYAIFYCYV